MNQKEFNRQMVELAESKGIEVRQRTKEEKKNLTKDEMLRNILSLYGRKVFGVDIAIGLIQKVALDTKKDWERIIK